MDSGFTPVVPSFDGPSLSGPLHELHSLETLECYKLVARLGRGGMAEVLLAAWEVEPFVHRPVVVKRLYEHLAEDQSLVQMFLDEARLLCQLEHPHIVKTFEAGVIDGQCCIAMEYLEGQPLQTVLRRAYERGKLPLELTATIVIGMLEGLHHAHDAKDESGRPLEVVHRDVSPQNVFVTSAGGVKILDFGIAKAASQAGRTATGIVKGKVGYMAPEQASAQSIDRRADVWSVGVVLWEAITGTRLFRADTDAGTITLMLTGDIPAASTLRPEVTPQLEGILKRALQRDPAERYRSALEMQRDLERWLVSTGHAKSPAALSVFVNEAFASELLDQRLLVSAQMARSDCTPSSVRPVRDSRSNIDELFQRDTVRPPSEVVEPPIRWRTPKSRVFLILAALVASIVVGRLVTARFLGNASSESSGATPLAVSEPPQRRDVHSPQNSEPASVPQVNPGTKVANPSDPAPPRANAQATPVAAVPPAPGLLRTAVRGSARAPVSTSVPAAPKSAPDEEVRPTAPAPRAETADTFGFLTIDTTPWSFVSTGGKQLGQTPLVGVKLPVGVHVLSLRNPDVGRQTSYTVTIESGKTVARRIGLE